MDLHIAVSPTPVCERFEDGVHCAECNQHLREEAYYDGVESYYCEHCIDKLIESAKTEARSYAEANCKITKPLPKYDPQYEYRCTPEEYEMGARESYTPNAHMCHCRHNCTNYEELMKPLDRDSVVHQVFYSAIHNRITELLDEVIAEMVYDEADEDEDFSATSELRR